MVGNRKYEADPGEYTRSLLGSASESANNRREIRRERDIHTREYDCLSGGRAAILAQNHRDQPQFPPLLLFRETDSDKVNFG